jgi:ribokinase
MGKIVVVGSINADMVFTSSIRPKAGETVLGESFSIIPGGKGANQAVAASKLGAESFMVGCVGKDSNGEFSIDNFNKYNVNTDCVEVISDVPTGVANIVVAEEDNSIIVIPGSNYKITKAMIDKHKEVILSADIVLLQLEIPIEIVEYTAELCKKNNVKVLLNPAPAKRLSESLIENSTYITPNEHEIKIILGKKSEDEIEALLKQYPNKIIVTMGSEGVKYFDEEIKTIPAFKIDVVDTTGAGDTFCGSLATALVNGKMLPDAISFANKAAALSTTKLGAQSGMPTIEELNNLK